MNVQQLLTDSSALKNHKVLKNGSYLVLQLKTANGTPVVLKIAHANNALIEREATRILSIKSTYPLLGARMPEILGQGVIGKGLYQDKSYFFQEFIPGSTLARHLQKTGTNPSDARNIIKVITSKLLDTVDEHSFDKSLDNYSGTWLKEYIGESYNRLAVLENIASLDAFEEIVINDQARKPLSHCFSEIFSSPAFSRLNKGPSTISILGHWNFHAENIILPEQGDPEGLKNFKVIDPDSKLDISDPLFGIGRLLYSFPHDTAEKNQYYIKTDALIPNSANSNRFNVHYTWPRNVIENYGALFAGMVPESPFNPEIMDPRLAEPKMALRLDLCFLLCLLRGISINHSNEFLVIDQNLTKFQNSAVLLFLNAVEFANILVERTKKYE